MWWYRCLPQMYVVWTIQVFITEFDLACTTSLPKKKMSNFVTILAKNRGFYCMCPSNRDLITVGEPRRIMPHVAEKVSRTMYCNFYDG